MFRLLFLGNSWADCVEVWYWDPISCSVCSSHGLGISARAHVHTALELYLINGLTEILGILARDAEPCHFFFQFAQASAGGVFSS